MHLIDDSDRILKLLIESLIVYFVATVGVVVSVSLAIMIDVKFIFCVFIVLIVCLIVFLRQIAKKTK